MNTNITDYGAVADSSVVCTAAIQSAIDACAASGGGRVTVPAGTFISGTIWLKSHVELHLEHGSKLVASTQREDYNALDAYEQNYSCLHEEWLGQHFILAIEQEDVAITGSGTLDGSGDSFFGEPRKMGGAGWMYGFALAKDKEQMRPGQLICFIECSRVAMADATVINAPCWSCFFHGCEVVSIRGLKIFNPPYCGNTDGIDIDSCRYVTVSDCIIQTGDDAIAVRCAAHRLRNKERICEYITITNCCLSACASIIRFGVGYGAIKHVQVSNLTVREAGSMFTFMTGYLGKGHVEIEDVHVQNVSAANVRRPFNIQDASEAGIRHISFSDIRTDARYPAEIATTKDGTISDIVFRNVDIEANTSRKKPGKENEVAQNVMNYKGVQDLLLERVRIHVEESLRDEWAQDVHFENCTEVEIYRCKYNL